MRTVISAFDDREEAHRAMVKVIMAGLPRDDVHVQPEAGSYPEVPTPSRDPPATWSISRWLEAAGRTLLGPPDPGEAGTARDAFRRGSAVVVAHIESDTEAARVARLMLQFGAFDVEDRTTQWRQTDVAC